MPVLTPDAFEPVPGYLNVATVGLPPRVAVDAVRRAVEDWSAGRLRPRRCDEHVAASRAAYARIVGADPSRVAVGSQTSVIVGLVASALPEGAEVVTVAGDFSSLVFPFLVHRDRGVRVRQVALAELADAIGPDTSAVAFSLVQSADGRIADHGAVRRAAAAVGALTVCDVTQAAGWLPLRADDYDVTVCSAYKWLCAPRGVAFATVAAGAQARLRPVHAGWYAGESVWESIYGPRMRLAGDARRFDVSPAWMCWAGAAAALDLFASADRAVVHRHDVGLAEAMRAALDLAPSGSAMVSIDDPQGRRLAALERAGCSVAGRGGGVRLAFHVWNDENDVDRAVAALTGSG